MENDIYFTLKGLISTEIKVKGSRFIGYASPVKTREEAESFIREISKKHHDATHNCYAYRVGLGDASIFRYNDAGEPSGTAGKPILEAIEGRELTNLVCVVTRYFGGTKLGTGGLARAYNQCAGKTLEKGIKIKCYITDTLRVVFDYNVTGSVMTLVSSYKGRVIKTLYSSKTEMILQIRQSKVDDFERKLTDITGGRLKVFREEVRGR